MKERIVLPAIRILFCLFFCAGLAWTLSAQRHRVGEIYTFADGSQGVVYYIDPEDPNHGWVAALDDLPGTYALWTGQCPQNLQRWNNYEPTSVAFIGYWSYTGWENTQSLFLSGRSPAASAVDVHRQWYIPDIVQLRKFYSVLSIVRSAVESVGGNVTKMMQCTHWSSTKSLNSDVMMYYLQQDGSILYGSGTESYAIRPVREFYDEIEAYWLDNNLNVMEVSPEETSIYDAVVIFGPDTLNFSSPVVVHEGDDTLYYVVPPDIVEDGQVTVACFTFEEVEGPGVYSQTEVLTSVFGCDSSVTIYLIVEEIVRDTVCESEYELSGWKPNADAQYWNGYDLEQMETDENGYFEFPGKVGLNGLEIDTMTYLDITVNPVYESEDMVEICHDEGLIEIPYWNHEDFTIVVNNDGLVDLQTIGDYQIEVLEQVGDDFPFVVWMHTTDGCDSIVHLTVRVKEVKKDTLVDNVLHIPGEDYMWNLAGHEFWVETSGVLTFADALSGSNGCDSITTRILIVEEPHYDTICDRTFTSAQTWQDNVAGYCWYANGKANCIAGMAPDAQGFYEFPGQREIDGRMVDTVSYLKLTVLPAIEGTDVLDLCLYEDTYTMVYNENVSVTVNEDGSVMATSLHPETVAVESVAGSGNMFILRMSRLNGCDSIVTLTVNHRYVRRDTRTRCMREFPTLRSSRATGLQ